MRPSLHRSLRATSWVLMSVAVLLVGYVGTLLGYESYRQHGLTAEWDRRHPSGGMVDARPTPHGAFLTRYPHLADGEPLFKLTIPRIHFSGVVTEGADTGILSSGPGHDDHTSYPGEGGLILFGNHNGFSMSWGDLGRGDEVVLDTDHGRHHYRIGRRSILAGDDRSYIDAPRDTETLALVTCWPLWQGALARQRLILEATPVVSA